jgi:uncharacterized protein (TIGR03437 family)
VDGEEAVGQTIVFCGLSVLAAVLFSGLAPGTVGEYQVNALVPIGGVRSNAVTIAVQ